LRIANSEPLMSLSRPNKRLFSHWSKRYLHVASRGSYLISLEPCPQVFILFSAQGRNSPRVGRDVLLRVKFLT